MNFKNLVLMCHECNSSNMLQKAPFRHIDPIHKALVGTRRKAFYSFASISPSITFRVTIASSDVNKMSESDITLVVNADGCDEDLSHGWMCSESRNVTRPNHVLKMTASTGLCRPLLNVRMAEPHHRRLSRK